MSFDLKLILFVVIYPLSLRCFFNSEMETEVCAKSHRLQWTWICNGDRESFMNKIIDDEAALYNHSQTPDCVEKGYIIIIIFIHSNIFFQHVNSINASIFCNFFSIANT